MRILFASLIGATIGCGLSATGEGLPMNANTWDVSDTSIATFEHIADRDALCIQGGAALVKGMETRDGVLSVDILNTGTPHFGYLVFRALDGENSEEVYLRMHKSRQLDALQYNPHLNDEFQALPRLSGPNAKRPYATPGFRHQPCIVPGLLGFF